MFGSCSSGWVKRPGSEVCSAKADTSSVKGDEEALEEHTEAPHKFQKVGSSLSTFSPTHTTSLLPLLIPSSVEEVQSRELTMLKQQLALAKEEAQQNAQKMRQLQTDCKTEGLDEQECATRWEKCIQAI